MIRDSTKAAEIGSAQRGLLQTSAMSVTVGFCGSPGVTVKEVPFSNVSQRQFNCEL